MPSQPATRCVCGKKLGVLQNGKPAKTCNRPGQHHKCAGKNSRKHMEELRGSSHTFIEPKSLHPYPENY